MSPPHILITNVFADDNRGGAAITAATIRAMQDEFPGCDITLLAVEQNKDRLQVTHRHTSAEFPGIRILPAAFQAAPGRLAGLRTVLSSLYTLIRPASSTSEPLTWISDSDMVVSKGGHVFIEREGLRGVMALWMTAWPLMYAWRLGIPTVAYCTSVGPFHSRTSRWINSIILRRTSLVIARDPLSYQAAIELGLSPEQVIEVPDSVFGFTPPAAEESVRMAAKMGFEGSSLGVVTVRTTGSAAERATLMTALADALRTILAKRVVEKIAIVVQVDGTVASDLSESEELLSRVDDPQVQLVRDDLSPRELMALYGSAEFLLGCRMHSTIFAMVAGTPAIAIALRGAKVRGVYESLGIDPCYVVPFDDVDPDTLVNLIQDVVHQNYALRERIARSVKDARERTSEARVPLQRILDSGRRPRTRPDGYPEGR